MESVPQIERYVRERRDTDQPLVSWALYFFLLSWVTFGIYSVVVFYRRLNRVQIFRVRKMHYYKSVLDFTRQYAEQSGQYETVYASINDTENFAKDRFTVEHREMNPGLTILLSFLTLGIYGTIMVYRSMRFWWEIQVTEQDFDERLSQVWIKLGIVKYPITFQPMQELRRSFWMHFLLSIVTFGIYGIIWDYRLHTDPDKVYPEFHSVEDAILNAARNPRA